MSGIVIPLNAMTSQSVIECNSQSCSQSPFGQQ
nr:MAG TPA: hypothetical protein [Caudoviricetes sp.]